MSSYRGRTGPNFSEYLNNLNTLAPFDQEHFSPEEFDLNQDLAMFTNTDFTHFDIPPLPEDGSFNFDMTETKNNNGPVKYEDLLSGSDTGHNYAPPQIETSAPESSNFYTTYNTPIQPAPAQGFGAVDSRGSPSNGSPIASQVPRKKESTDLSAITSEEKSRIAAEEDKRRRNTAASARFRIKKKQREQALEKTVKEVQDKNTQLEVKLRQMEVENKWLRDLIMEKNGLQSKEEMAAAYQQYRKDSEERDVKERQLSLSSSLNTYQQAQLRLWGISIQCFGPQWDSILPLL